MVRHSPLVRRRAPSHAHIRAPSVSTRSCSDSNRIGASVRAQHASAVIRRSFKFARTNVTALCTYAGGVVVSNAVPNTTSTYSYIHLTECRQWRASIGLCLFIRIEILLASYGPKWDYIYIAYACDNGVRPSECNGWAMSTSASSATVYRLTCACMSCACAQFPLYCAVYACSW